MPVFLYPRQREIYHFIKQYIQKEGSAPTLRQIADMLGIRSLATVSEHLKALERKGVIERLRGAVKGIKLVEYMDMVSDPMSSIAIPIVGYIAAGKPIEAIEDTTTTMKIPTDMVSANKRTFILQVVGDSMVDAHICDGDFVVCEQVKGVSNGEIVVAIVDDHFATLKRFFKEKDRIRLQPENETMDPIYSTKVEIKGRVVGVIRKYK